MNVEGGAMRLEQLALESYGPVVGFFALHDSAAATYAGMEEWPGITLPVRHELLEIVRSESTGPKDSVDTYLIHTYDIARVLHISGKLSRVEAMSYAKRAGKFMEFSAHDGEYIDYPSGS